MLKLILLLVIIGIGVFVLLPKLNDSYKIPGVEIIYENIDVIPSDAVKTIEEKIGESVGDARNTLEQQVNSTIIDDIQEQVGKQIQTITKSP